MLGTTKPPLHARARRVAVPRRRGCDVRLVDLTATGQSVADLIARLDAEAFQPTLIVFPSTTPTLDADVVAMAHLKTKYGAPLFCFGPHASCTPVEAMARAPEVDGMFVGEPEDGLLQLATLDSLDRLGEIPSLTFRRGGRVVPHRAHGSFTGFLEAPYPAWDLLDLGQYRLPLVNQPYVIVENVARLPVLVRFLRRAHPSGPQVPREEREGAGRRDGARLPRVRAEVLLPLGRHGHAQREVVQRVLRRADRAQTADAVVRQRARGQPDRPRVREAPARGRAAGCWRSASRPSRKTRART